jgi:gliding motility-associated lipoprotein GldH
MKTGITKLIYPALIISLSILCSCDRTIISADITDTANNFNILFTIRNSSSYPFRNIFLFVTTTSPAGASITDTLEYMLADEKGNWYGKGIGDIHELTVQYKSNIYFPEKGIYSFKVQHGMRVEDLSGIYDFGIRIVKTNNK